VQAYQYDRRPSRTRRSFLSIVSDLGDGSDSDGNGAILTAFKPPQKGRGWIVRLFNPLDRQVEVFITPYTRPEHVQLLNMAEESIRYLDPDANGRALISIKPQQIVTLRLTFE
jgi:alpha-mannosidase